MTDSDTCPFLKLEPNEIKQEPFDVESNERSPRSNCNPVNDQLGDVLREFSSKSDGGEKMEVVFKIEESEVNLTLIKEEEEDDTFHENSEIKIFKCNICPYQSDRKYNLERHLLNHNLKVGHSKSGKKTFQCPECPYIAKCRYKVVRHGLVHTRRMHECSLCSFRSKNNYNLKSHMNRHKKESEMKMFICKLCNYQNRRELNFKRHMFYRHDSTTEYKCDKCDYTTKYSYILKQHSISHKDKSEVKTFICAICGFQSRWKTNLIKHIKAHYKEKMKKEK